MQSRNLEPTGLGKPIAATFQRRRNETLEALGKEDQVNLLILTYVVLPTLGFRGGLDGKESACDRGDLASIPGLGRSPGEGNGNPLQYACLENPTDRGAWQVTVHGVTESDMTE